jgi:hypothetical protein
MFQRDLFATFLNAEFNVFKKTSRAGGRSKAENDGRQTRTTRNWNTKSCESEKVHQTHTICTILLAEEAEEEQKRFHVKLCAFFVGVFHL